MQAVAANLPPAATESFTLRHAQQVIAHEYEFTSWQALVDHVGDTVGKDESTVLLPGPYSTLALEHAILAVAALSGCDSPAALAQKIAETQKTWLLNKE